MHAEERKIAREHMHGVLTIEIDQAMIDLDPTLKIWDRRKGNAGVSPCVAKAAASLIGTLSDYGVECAYHPVPLMTYQWGIMQITARFRSYDCCGAVISGCIHGASIS